MKANKTFLRHALLWAFCLMAVTQGARAWDGSGTSVDPYLIKSTGDWAELANSVNAGNSYSGTYFRLTKDIDAGGSMVGAMSGATVYNFSGIFDGDGHTIILNEGTGREPKNDVTAPFRYLSGATIRHLRTAGAIFSRGWYNAGIAGRISGPGATTLYDCHSAITVNICSASTPMNSGGMVGEVAALLGNKPDSVVVERCTFTGKLVEYVNLDVKGCAGFIGHVDPYLTATLRDCVFDPHDWNYHDAILEGSTFANTESGTVLNLERCYATFLMKKHQGVFILNEMQVPEGVTYEFQGEPDVTLGGEDYWTNGCWVRLTVPEGTKFKYWFDDGNHCFVSDPFTASGLHQLKDLYAKPNLKIITSDIPEPETERTLWGVTYRYLSRADYHFYVSDEDCKARGWYFEGNDASDMKANLVKYDADGDASEITAITGYKESDYNSDGVQIHNDLVGDWRNHTHLGLIAPHAFKNSKKLETIYFKDTDADIYGARTSFSFTIDQGAFEGCTNFKELKMMQYTTTGSNHWEALSPGQVLSVADDAFEGCTKLQISAQADKYQSFMASNTWKAHRSRFIIYEATTVDFTVDGVRYHWFRSFDQQKDLKNDSDGKSQMMDQIRSWNADYREFSAASLLDTEDDCNVYYATVIGVDDSKLDDKDGVMRIYNDPGTNYNYKTIALQRDAIAGNTHVKAIEFYQTNGNGENSCSNLKMVIPNGALKGCTNLKELRMFYYVQDGSDHWETLGPKDVIPGSNIFGFATTNELKNMTEAEAEAQQDIKSKDFKILVAPDLYNEFLSDPNWQRYAAWIEPVDFEPMAKKKDFSNGGLNYAYMTAPGGILQTSQVVSQDVSWWTAPRIAIEVALAAYTLGSFITAQGATNITIPATDAAMQELQAAAGDVASAQVLLQTAQKDMAIVSHAIGGSKNDIINSILKFAASSTVKNSVEGFKVAIDAATFAELLQMGIVNQQGAIIATQELLSSLTTAQCMSVQAAINDFALHELEFATMRLTFREGVRKAAENAWRNMLVKHMLAEQLDMTGVNSWRAMRHAINPACVSTSTACYISTKCWGGSGSYHADMMNKGMRENILSNIHQVGLVGGSYVITTPQKNLVYHTYIKSVDSGTTDAVIHVGFDNDNDVNTSNRTMTFLPKAFRGKTNLKTVKFHEISGQTSNTGMPMLFTIPDSAFVGCTKLKTFSTLLETDDDGTRPLGPENFILAGDSIFAGLKCQAEVDSLTRIGQGDGLVAFSIVIDPSRKQDFLDNASWAPLQRFFKYQSAAPKAKYNEYGAQYAYAYESNSIKKQHKVEGHLIEHTIVTGPDNDFIQGHQGAVKLCNDIGVFNNYQLDAVMPLAFKGNKHLRSVSFTDLYGSTITGDTYTGLQVHIGDSAFVDCTNLADLDLLYMVTDGTNSLDPITPQQLTIGRGVFDGTKARLKMTPQQVAWFEADSAWAAYKDRFMPCVIRMDDEGVMEGLQEILKPMAYYDPANTGSDDDVWNDYIDFARIAGAGFSWLDGKFKGKGNIYTFADFRWFESVGLDYVGASWFDGCSNLSNIVLPGTTRTIRTKAFKGCTSLREFELPMGVADIQGEAFGGCTALNTIVVRDSVPATLGGGAFHAHDGLKIYVPAPRVADYKKAWSDYAQYIAGDDTYKVNKVVTVTAVGQLASKLGLTVTKKNSKVQYLHGPYAKYDSLIVIGPLNGEDVGVLRHMMGADAYDSDPTDGCLRYLNLWDADLKKDTGTSYNGYGVDEYLEKDNWVGEYMFHKCNALETLILPKSVTEIGENTFQEAMGLKRIAVGSKTTAYTRDLLQDLNGIEELVFLTEKHAKSESSDPWEAPIQQVWTLPSQTGDYLGDVNLTRQAQSVMAPFNEDAVMWSLAEHGHFFPSEYIELESVEGIFKANEIQHFDDFDQFQNVKKLDRTFSGAYNLKTITLPSSIEEIGASAFNVCTSLDTIRIYRDSVPTLGKNAFAYLPSDFKILVPKRLCKLYREKWAQYADHINPDTEGYATDIVTITVTEPNTVAEKLGLEMGLKDYSLVWSGKVVNGLKGDYSNIRRLKIVGPISSGDLDVLRCMAGFTPWINTRNYSGHLEYIDLYDARLVKTDVFVRGRKIKLDPTFLGQEHDDYYKVEDNVLPHHAFLRAYGLKTLILPKTCKKVNERALQECEGMETLVLGDDMEDFNWNALDDDAMLTRMYILAKQKVKISTQFVIWRKLCNNYNPTFDAFYVRPSLYDEYIADDDYTGSSWQRTNNISKGVFGDDEDEEFAVFAAHAAATQDDLASVYSVDGWFDNHKKVKDLTALGYTAVSELRAADMQQLTQLERVALPVTLEAIEDSVFAKAKGLRYVDMLLCDSTLVVDDIKARTLAKLGIDSLRTLTYLPQGYGEAKGVNIVVANAAKLEAEAFRLVDSLDYCVPYAFETSRVETSRVLPNANGKYTICLPYELDVPYNVVAYVPTGREGYTLTFTQTTERLKALTPYLVIPKADGVTLPSDVKQTIPASDASTMAGQVNLPGYTMRGTLKTIDNKTAHNRGAWIMQKDNKWWPVPANVPVAYVRPFNCYLLQSGISGANSLDMEFVDQTDGIDTIRTVDLDGTERYYDLNGRQLPGKPQRGVYIHNGKKRIAHGQQ